MGRQQLLGLQILSCLRCAIGAFGLLIGLAAAAACMTGCAIREPHTRLGALPFPGPMTLFALADPDHLGTACYEVAPQLLESGECGHGILYTRRAGFLDIAHLRESMDWARYTSVRVAEALNRKQTSLVLPGFDHCPFHLAFNYPADWDAMRPELREKIIGELSIRIGCRVALNAMTWHEIITWFGYGTTGVWSEKGSAFTYEDTMSHVIGVIAADEALRHPTGSWDQDATRALDNQLKSLGVVSKRDAARAVELVKGKWWENAVCTRRMLDIGLDGDRVRPWLVRDMPDGDAPAQSFPLPTFTDVQGRDFTGFWSMTIEFSWLIPSRVRKICGGNPRINPQTHFPLLMLKIRREVHDEFGPKATQPQDH